MESKTYKTGVDKDLDQRFDEIGKLPEDYADVKDFSKDHKFEEVFEKDLGLSK